MIIKHGRHIFWEIHEVCKGTVCGLFFLDCTFQMLVGWEDKLHSHGCVCVCVILLSLEGMWRVLWNQEEFGCFHNNPNLSSIILCIHL